MKILEINKFFFPQGGADRHFLDLTDLLQKEGHEVAVFSMENSKNEATPWNRYFVSEAGYLPQDGFWKNLKGILRIYSFESKRKIGKLLDDFQPDIVHIHNIYHQISPSIFSEIKKRKIPVIMTVHDYKLICPNYLFLCRDRNWDEISGNKNWYFLRNKCFKNSYFKSLLALIEWNVYKTLRIYEKNVGLFIAPSQFLKDKLVGGGLNPEKIVVLPHFGKNSKLDDRPGGDHVLHFGRLSRNKGTQDIIDIFKKHPDIELRLAGKLEEDLDFVDFPNIKYLGILDNQGIKEEIQKSMFVVSASRLPETFGLVALETLENGRPFVSLCAGAYGEIVEDGKSGFLCRDIHDLEEKILYLAKDKELRAKMGQEGLRRAEKFLPDGYLKEFWKEIDFLAKKC